MTLPTPGVSSSSAIASVPISEQGILSWEAHADLPDPVGWKGMYGGVSGDRVILAGGSNFPVSLRAGGRKMLSRQILTRSIHASASEAWQLAAEALPEACAEGAAVGIAEGVVLLGGVGEGGPIATVSLLRWDSRMNAVEIRALTALPVPCASPAAVHWRGRIFVAGGEKDGRGLAHFWSLDVAAALAGEPAAVWKALPTWPGPARFGAVLAVLETGGREEVFLFGGRTKAGGATAADYLKDVCRYDPLAERWTALRPMPHPAVLAGNIRLGASMVAVLGGSDGHDLHRIAELGERYRLPDRILVYDSRSDDWSDGGRMPLGVVAAAIVPLEQGWLVAGGEYSPGVRTAWVHHVRAAR